jgi:hypothetical protein
MRQAQRERGGEDEKQDVFTSRFQASVDGKSENK